MFDVMIAFVAEWAARGGCERHDWKEVATDAAGADTYELQCSHCHSTVTLRVDGYGHAEHIGGSYDDGAVIGLLFGPAPEAIPAGCGCPRHEWAEYSGSRVIRCRYALNCVHCGARVTLCIDGHGFVEVLYGSRKNACEHVDREARYRANRIAQLINPTSFTLTTWSAA